MLINRLMLFCCSRGETCTRDEKRLKMKKKWMTKGESGLIWGKKGVSLLLPAPSLSLPSSTWVIVACQCFWLCREAHLLLSLSVSLSECFLKSPDKNADIEKFLWHRWVDKEIISGRNHFPPPPSENCLCFGFPIKAREILLFHRLRALTLSNGWEREKHCSLLKVSCAGTALCWCIHEQDHVFHTARLF